MDCPGHRRIQLMPATRTLTLNRDNGEITSISYFGLTLIRHHGDQVLDERWLPQGEQPDFSDDENLIDALQQAFAWTAERDDRPAP